MIWVNIKKLEKIIIIIKGAKTTVSFLLNGKLFMISVSLEL
jgi:hypothetical protein